ncbi:ABC transporter permease subunit [Facilibium subflavum]|uniref:ABC transporter permease subunit n=1 Tax=Facilibium subflavum TaxID=2219058 RepID=UPI0013C2CA55|nr:ABC transporter permease subunit [Facilibium subflavum]
MFELVYDYAGIWAHGIWLTIELTLLAIIISLPFALFLAWAKLQHNHVVSTIINSYLYIVRGTPFLIQLFIIYYGSTQSAWLNHSWLGGILGDAFISGLVALVINASAYACTLFYGGLQNLDRDEVLSAQAIGLTQFQSFIYVMLPNLFIRLFPAYINEIIMVLKCSALVSTIAILDITGSAQLIISDSYQSLNTLFIAAIFYTLITIAIVIPLKQLYNKTTQKYHDDRYLSI